jgi:DinB superfamily
MGSIECFTLQRVWTDLTDDELFWEPVPRSWGIRRRGDCDTPTPFGDGNWVTDFDVKLVVAALSGKAIEPLTTIGWLLWHIGSMPGRAAQLDLFGGSHTVESGWTSPYLTHHPVFSSAAEAVESMRAGWQALRTALERTTDDQLERGTHAYSYGSGPPSGGVLTPGDGPGPETTGTAIVIGVLNEVSHHGSQICVLRDLYRVRV